ncbi:Rv0909 family putative TA system antitoxin [Kribbella sp. NBC_00382]|uniref:antitoxin n=1 Tax=Kribbella sp. NBC_00382 TaxID=2975967 RepID=UPI002E1C39AE
MNDFQDQAKNWLRNVVKQNPDKIKAGVEKAGDLIDKQTGGKYADKVDSVQEKVGTYVDSHAEQPTGGPGTTSTEQSSEDTTTADAPTAGADEPTAEPADSVPDQSAGPGTADANGTAEAAPDAVDEATPEAEGTVDEVAPEPSVDEAGSEVDEAAPDAVDGTVVGGETPDVAENPSSSAGSGTEGAETGSTATGTSDGGLPGPR